VNIAVLGGTFNPVHNGHLMAADTVAGCLGAQVLFVPAGQPWLKSERYIAPAADRLEMVRRAIHGDNRYSLSVAETERSGPSYTVDTIRQMKGQLAPCDELYFVLGWDALSSLSRWREPESLIQMCRLVAVPRIGYSMPDSAVLENLLPGLSQRVLLLDKPELDISASVIRERVRCGLSISHLVPRAVEGYIKENGLYSHDG
jgi:nicotinate-nucleotide adenylyltransferase